MTAHRLILTPEAELDVENAFQWYESQRSGLGQEFLETVDVAFARIREAPEDIALVSDKARLVCVKRFPYVICYLLNDNTIFVVAVFHGHRDPETWQSRIS